MSTTPPGPTYVKPFHLFRHNKPKLPPTPPRKKVDYRRKPKVPVRTTLATKLRNTTIQRITHLRKNLSHVDYKTLAKESAKKVTAIPKLIPRDSKTFEFRYKWVREIPVVSCRFTEHVMMYRKPPFVRERNKNVCGVYELRKMLRSL